LWRIEGVDVPAAFHFPNVDFVGGGGYTVLSNQMLRNSDFYTGAFPAEYGNAVRVYLILKCEPETQKKENSPPESEQVVLIFRQKGHLLKGKNQLTCLITGTQPSLFWVKLTNFPNIPTFQDLTYKFEFPTSGAGTFSFWAIIADDINKKEADSDTLNWKTDYDRTGQDYFNRFGAIGLSHRISVGTTTFFTQHLALMA
jgi:hypothetical protein